MNYRELPEISENLTKIVDLVFQFRFINRRQFQKFFGHKDPSRLNKWLKELVDKKYLGRIYSNKLLENTKPAIYYLGNNGIVWVKWEGMAERRHYDGIDTKYVKKFYQDRSASESFINHCITLFDLYLQVKEKEKTKKNKDLEYWFHTKTEIWIEKQLSNQDKEDFDEIKELIPDAHIEKSIVSEEKVEEKNWYIILFDPHVPRYAMRYKVDKYIDCHEENDGKKIPKLIYDNFPALLLIFPTQQKANQIGKYIKKQLTRSFTTNMEIYTSTIQKVLTEGLFGGDRTWKVVEEDSEI